MLDGLVRYPFGAKPELMAAWASARNVEGPFRSKAVPLIVLGIAIRVERPKALSP